MGLLAPEDFQGMSELDLKTAHYGLVASVPFVLVSDSNLEAQVQHLSWPTGWRQ